MTIISGKLKELIDKMGISAVEAAKRCGMSESEYRNFQLYVQGKRSPNFNTLLMICKGLKTTPNYLFSFPEEKAQVNDILLSRIIERMEEYKKYISLTAAKRAETISIIYEHLIENSTDEEIDRALSMIIKVKKE